ncbi:MAG: acyl-CoA dehydrogenase family protein [Burkholderiaceae bacterium]
MTATPTASELAVPLGNDYPEIRESIRRICAGFPGEYWRDLDARSAYPDAFVKALTEGGWLSVLIPEEYGGAGLPLRAASVILEEIHAAGCSAGACHAQMYTMGTLLRHGSAEQKQRFLPGIASGALRLQAFGITEPTTGSDTTQIRTRAERSGDKYVVNGQKVWTSRALHSDLMMLLVRTTPADQVAKKTDGISVLIVDMREARGKGLEIRPIRAMVNHNTTEIFIDNLEVPVANRIGDEGRGFKYILDGMNAERIIAASEAIGDTRWFIRKATDYANQRVVFGRPIGQNQGIQFPIARAYAELSAAEMMVRKATALFAAGRPCGEDANIAKMLASEAAWHAGEACLQTHGGFGFAAEYDVERKWREVRVMQVAPVSTNLILAHVAEHVLGLPRSY